MTPSLVFTVGPHPARIDPETGKVLEWRIWSDDDFAAIAANAQSVLKTKQRIPIILEHSNEGAVGDVLWIDHRPGELHWRYKLLEDYADAHESGQVRGYSVEIARDGEAFGFRGTDGYTLRRVALLLDTDPRDKVGGVAPLYADSYSEGDTLATWSGSEVDLACVYYAEDGYMPEPTAVTPPAAPAAPDAGATITPEGFLAALEKAGVDSALVEFAKALMGAGKTDANEEAEDDEAKKKAAAAEAAKVEENEETEEKEKKDVEEMSELRSRLERAEKRERATAKAHRATRLEVFGEEVRRKAGPAEAKKWLAKAAKDIAVIAELDVYDEKGTDRVRATLDELLALVPERVFGEPGAIASERFKEIKAAELETFDEKDVEQKLVARGYSANGAKRRAAELGREHKARAS